MPTKKEPDAPAEDTTETVDDGGVRYELTPPIKSEHGAQVVLTGRARSAARGGLHGDVTSNTIARDTAVAEGEAIQGAGVHTSALVGRFPGPETGAAIGLNDSIEAEAEAAAEEVRNRRRTELEQRTADKRA